MEEMVEAGVDLTDVSYATLVQQLMFEGRFIEARAVVDMEMPSVGVVPDDRTHALFEEPEREWNKMRMAHLQGFFETRTPRARQQAMEFFEGLKASGTADAFHWALMLKQCDTSAEQRIMMRQMAHTGVDPDLATYTLLATQLTFEGKCGEARALLETEMPAAEVLPDERMHELFESSEETWSRMRTTRIHDLLKTGKPEAIQQAQAFFKGPKASGAASVYQWNLFQAHRKTSTEQRSMIQAMTDAGVKPNAASYNTFSNQLMIEGRFEEARTVVELEMLAAGIVPDDYTHAVFERPEETWRLG